MQQSDIEIGSVMDLLVKVTACMPSELDGGKHMWAAKYERALLTDKASCKIKAR